MARFGYTLMTEQSGPAQLVQYAAAAEQVGFDFALCSDHYNPWLESQGHAPYAWAVLGAVAQATHRMELVSYVTCPTHRYHPTIVAQKAATLGLLSDGRFILGLGSGENLNEHVIGQGWPTAEVRQSMLQEAMMIIRQLLGGETVTSDGDFFHVSQAKLWDCPQDPIQMGVAVSGSRSIKRFAPLADHLISTTPDHELLDQWDEARPAGGPTARSFLQLPICWAPDESTAVSVAHDQFRWSIGSWSVNAELPSPASFAAATEPVRVEDVTASIPCGPDLDRIAKAFEPAVQAGFTDIGLVQVGDQHQQQFLDQAAGPLLERLHRLG
ncbi:TIGR03557 family F420-dependent LLM class oxidoreductase [Microlunatus elymi]|uniref:TIGR03557 family F420-dependent LLM class oxidoreductase n=1 Tax=Microlunatus elymi TaxID=2596828 RepID=A0A516PW92_9ACTN|nr:TIGR03557 family F420-dependent LLM class oxidoreductase [Microlunatus elymi]QDP95456.1 TIGR03557 family F420-dependent LLM class oxidoreductase [Microlunatus elymi]